MNVYHPIWVLTNLLTRASKTLFFSLNSCLLELWASSLISPHCKEGGIYCCVALYHFFNEIVVVGVNVRECHHVSSHRNDITLPPPPPPILVSLYKKWCCEKNGEILLRIDFLQIFAFTFLYFTCCDLTNPGPGISQRPHTG
jgi:hypothetical protein